MGIPHPRSTPFVLEWARTARDELSALAGETVGPSGATWQDIAGTLSVNLECLSRWFAACRTLGEPSPGDLAFVSATLLGTEPDDEDPEIADAANNHGQHNSDLLSPRLARAYRAIMHDKKSAILSDFDLDAIAAADLIAPRSALYHGSKPHFANTYLCWHDASASPPDLKPLPNDPALRMTTRCNPTHTED